ncbi:MAG: HNH endonuclease [Armatimonadota bacterium]
MESGTTLILSLTKRAGSGRYFLADAPISGRIIHAVLQRHNRQVVLTQADSRAIPQHVKAAVWQRDRGVCVQCGSSQYLEFDHVIPFSLGGATSEANLQLLCRACNIAKSDSL